ncbi:MAG: orotidine-5'-phosphate decarboxylase [Bacteroidetes bacterium]|nr:orotidine-5'-phosphate decarboxylase [Bacteroidota bacterium]
MKRKLLTREIFSRKSFLCIGLDTDIRLLPPAIQQKKDSHFLFNKCIADATAQHCIAFKINTAFYEANGSEGWKTLEKTASYLKTNYPNHFLIADAKRGDIGNTSAQYARAFFEAMDFDAVTVNPYPGKDSVVPFLGYESRWIIILALTSNKSAEDFQISDNPQREKNLFEKIIRVSGSWGNKNNTMFVTGATRASHLRQIRKLVPHHFLLVPGIGAQKGNLDEVIRNGWNRDCGLIVNVSRSIIYAGSGPDFDKKAAVEAGKLHEKIKLFFDERKIVKN